MRAFGNNPYTHSIRYVYLPELQIYMEATLVVANTRSLPGSTQGLVPRGSTWFHESWNADNAVTTRVLRHGSMVPGNFSIRTNINYSRSTVGYKEARAESRGTMEPEAWSTVVILRWHCRWHGSIKWFHK